MNEFTKEDVLIIIAAAKKLGSNYLDNYRVGQITVVKLFPPIERVPILPHLPVKDDTITVLFKKVATIHGFEWQFHSLEKPLKQ